MSPTRRKYALFSIFMLISLVLDQWTKVLARQDLRPRGPFNPKVLVDGYFDLRYAENPGVAFSMLDEVRRECRERADLARRILAGRLEPQRLPASPHVWLPLSELESERVAGQAARAGVQVTPPQAPFVSGAAVSGLRLCLGGAPEFTVQSGG